MREVAERMEREALLDLCTAAKERLGLEWHAQPLGGGLAVHCPSIDNFWFNRVLGLGHDLTLSRAALTEQIEAYGAARLSRYFVHLYEDPRPSELPAWLEALGAVGWWGATASCTRAQRGS